MINYVDRDEEKRREIVRKINVNVMRTIWISPCGKIANLDIDRVFLCIVTDISQIMAKSRDWNELQYVWTEWRRRSGAPIRDLYQQLVTLNNEAARLNSMFSII